MKRNKLSWLFFGLSCGLTLISLMAGYYVYAALFGAATAVLVSSVFEVLRLSCLFSVPSFSWKYKPFAISLYVLVASLCFAAAVVSFNSRVINKHQNQTVKEVLQQQKDLYNVRKAYSEKTEVEIARIQKDKAITEKKYTSWQSAVYKRRLQMADEKIRQLRQKRESFFTELDKHINDSGWINNQKAVLGVDSNTVVSLNDGITQALIEIFNISYLTTQKVFGFALSLVVELGIILLSVLGFEMRRKTASDDFDKDDLLEYPDTKSPVNGVFDDVIS